LACQAIRFLFEKRSPTVNRQWGSLSTQNKNGQEKAAYVYIRRGHISEGLICFLFFTAAAAAAAAIAIFLRMTTVSHRGSIRHRRKPIRCQPADLIIHERKKKEKKMWKRNAADADSSCVSIHL
jgi:hypothetical protein